MISKKKLYIKKKKLGQDDQFSFKELEDERRERGEKRRARKAVVREKKKRKEGKRPKALKNTKSDRCIPVSKTENNSRE